MKKLILSLTLLALLNDVVAQSISITPGTSNAVCPGTAIAYTASNPNGSPPACQYEWTVTKGRFDAGGNIGRTVRVIWNDETGTGTLKVVLQNCDALSSGFENASKTNTYTILSVFGQSFGSYRNSVNVPYCYSIPITVTLTVPKMYVQGTGGAGQPPRKEVDAYSWTIPTGWAINGPIYKVPLPTIKRLT
ncbi:MAG TPA: hypothetical protein VFW78_02350 [Bacteroidia bacterium]|nr:hypothetical protein [Bacteroidia bacterium]